MILAAGGGFGTTMSGFLIVFGWLILSCIVGAIAESRGRFWPGYFFLSLIFSPLIGFLVVIALPVITRPKATQGTAEPVKRCPFCAETILAAAVKCKHCGSALEATPVEAPTPATGRELLAKSRLFR